MSVAVVLPCRNTRHLLWRSLASVAAQTVPPAQVLVLDRGSTDGLADWLRIRWPGVEHRSVPAAADPGAIAASIATAVAAPAVAVLRPGEHWPRTHLEALLASTSGGSLVPTAELAAPAGAAGLPWPAEDGAPAAGALEEAVASLPRAPEAILLDLRAAGSPLGLLDLLGLAALLGPTGRTLRALSLADPLRTALTTAPPTAPLVISHLAALGSATAAEQLCIEELLRLAPDRPVRLVLAGLCPASPALLSRLLDALLAHGDLELWLADAVSCRLATALIGTDRVRLVAPPMLALAPLLGRLTEGQLIQPAMLGSPACGTDLDDPRTDHLAWWAGFDPDAARRLGPALARVLGAWRWLKGPLLQQAWLTALVGWAAMRSRQGTLHTRDSDLAMFAGLCGRPVELAAREAKARDLVMTWRQALTAIGIASG